MDGQNNSQNPQQPTAPVAPTPETQAPAMPTPPAPTAPQVPQQPAPAPAESAPQPAAQTAPAAPQPEAMPGAPVQQTPAPQPAAPMPDTLQQAAGVPAVPPAPKKGISIWLVMSFIVLLLAGAGWYYFYLLNKTQPVQETSRLPYPTKAAVSPTVVVSLSPSPAGTTSASGKATPGTVSGTLCYPSSVIPAGTITAKDVTTNKLYTQAYAGSAVARSTTYTFALPAGTYHLKFTPTSSPTTVGYYTDYSSCVGNPTGPNCSGQKVRPVLSATVSATLGAGNVNLCDYYYPTNTPPQF